MSLHPIVFSSHACTNFEKIFPNVTLVSLIKYITAHIAYTTESLTYLKSLENCLIIKFGTKFVIPIKHIISAAMYNSPETSLVLCCRILIHLNSPLNPVSNLLPMKDNLEQKYPQAFVYKDTGFRVCHFLLNLSFSSLRMHS